MLHLAVGVHRNILIITGRIQQMGKSRRLNQRWAHPVVDRRTLICLITPMHHHSALYQLYRVQLRTVHGCATAEVHQMEVLCGRECQMRNPWSRFHPLRQAFRHKYSKQKHWRKHQGIFYRGIHKPPPPLLQCNHRYIARTLSNQQNQKWCFRRHGPLICLARTLLHNSVQMEDRVRQHPHMGQGSHRSITLWAH